MDSMNQIPGQMQGINQNINGVPVQMNITPDMLNYYVSMMQNQPIDRGEIKSSEMAIKGTWTVQEDELLRDAVQKIGTTKWIDIAKFVPSRTPKQCRERWHNRLSPELKHGPFEPWEDQIIITKQKEIGNRWSLIAQSLPGRSPGAVKNRWYAGLRNSNQNNDFSISQINRMITEQQITPNQLEQV